MATGRVVEVSIMVCGKLPACVTHDMKMTRHLCHQEDRAFSEFGGAANPACSTRTKVDSAGACHPGAVANLNLCEDGST